MEWWGWITWATTLITAVTALVLGIRAERRARYHRHWTMEIEPRRVTFHNRTGEDASNVWLRVSIPWQIGSRRAVMSMVPADGEAAFVIHSPEGTDRDTPFVAWLTWQRSSTGREYTIRCGTP